MWNFVITVSIMLNSLQLGQGSDGKRFPDTPDNHWVYQGMADLKSVGILVGFPDGLGYNTWQYRTTRGEFAVVAVAAASALDAKVKALRLNNERISQFSGGRVGYLLMESNRKNLQSEYGMYFHLIQQIQVDITSMVKEFAPELRSLGADPREMLDQARRDCDDIARFRVSEIGESTRQFKDVPKDHWASRATIELRRVGILHGYPEGHLYLRKSSE